MAKTQTRTNVIDEARARFEDALGNAKREFKRVQKDAEKRRKDLEARVEREVKKFRTELEKSPVAKRAQELREQAETRVEQLRDELRESAVLKRAEEIRGHAQARYGEMLGYAGIATAAEVERLEKRVAALSREMKAKKTAKRATVAVA
jgi:replication fork clamp-binding protein CrfC